MAEQLKQPLLEPRQRTESGSFATGVQRTTRTPSGQIINETVEAETSVVKGNSLFYLADEDTVSRRVSRLGTKDGYDSLLDERPGGFEEAIPSRPSLTIRSTSESRGGKVGTIQRTVEIRRTNSQIRRDAEKGGAGAGGEGGINDHDEEGGGKARKPFVKSHGLTTAEADRLLLQYGKNELVEVKTPKWRIFVNQLIEVHPSPPFVMDVGFESHSHNAHAYTNLMAFEKNS